MTTEPEATPESDPGPGDLPVPDPQDAPRRPVGPRSVAMPAMRAPGPQVPQIPLEQAWRNIVTATRGFSCNADQRDALNASLTAVATVLQEVENAKAAQAEAPASTG